MYVVNNKIDSESRATNFIDVGIHDNVELVGVEYSVSPKGNEFLVFHFVKDGKTLDHTEYKPKDEDLTKLESKTVNQIKRVKHIVTKFIKEEAYDFSAANFKEFCEKTIALLGTTYKGVKVRLKVIYSNNNFTSLPKYVPFIERMDHPGESTLEILSIDKMTKDRPDVEVSVGVNPFAKQPAPAAEVGSTNWPDPVAEDSPSENDLPF